MTDEDVHDIALLVVNDSVSASAMQTHTGASAHACGSVCLRLRECEPSLAGAHSDEGKFG